VKTESTDSQFNGVRLLSPDKLIKFKAVTTNPDTVNQPVSVLSDGKLGENYGPVFPNEVVRGTYQIDLGKNTTVSQIRSFSFNQNGNRARQRFTLMGINEKKVKEPIPIATVNTTSRPTGKYLASSVQASDGTDLGTFRWIAWVLQPVTAQQENTAFQEFQVTKQ
jgi:hypothetical protein